MSTETTTTPGVEKKMVILSVAGLRKDIMELGLTRAEMATKYDLAAPKILQALKQAGLDKIKAEPFRLVFDEATEAPAVVAVASAPAPVIAAAPAVRIASPAVPVTETAVFDTVADNPWPVIAAPVAVEEAIV